MPEVVPFISFPEGYLGSRSAKFPLLANTPEIFAVNKPSGLACFQHDWTQGRPDFTSALRRELLQGKPQLIRLGIGGVFRIFNLDAEISGALLYAKSPEAEEKYRNAFGSRQIRMFYHFLATSESEERERLCELPLARHTNEERMIVTHKTGKKCRTQFRFLRNFGRYELWEAEAVDLRTHQVRIHAAEVGLTICGEDLYMQGEKVMLSSIKRGYRPSRGRERPIYDMLCLHLQRLEFEVPEVEIEPVMAPLPGKFGTLLKQLGEHKGGWRPS